jgi:uncharacterized protein YgbK (DUF1537 family)
MPLLLTFYADDFTGSTDALEQLSLAGIRTALFIEPPTPAQLKNFPGLQAVGVAGKTRSLAPDALEGELRPALLALRKLGARQVHYKVCSTFDSSPTTGSIGRVLDVAAKIFPAAFIPLLVAAPALGRYTVFGTHFARYGIGSAGAIYRLDQHPAISKHPVTPMTEADLRKHLAQQTKKKIALFDILQLALPEKNSRVALKKMLLEKPDVVLFDALTAEHLTRIGGLIHEYASAKRPLFSVGSSGIEAAVAAHCMERGQPCSRDTPRPLETRGQGCPRSPASRTPLLALSGSCSPVTGGQIAWALKHGFAEVRLDLPALVADTPAEINRAAYAANSFLNQNRSVIVHTTKRGADKKLPRGLAGKTAHWIGAALGMVAYSALFNKLVRRICIAGGDTSGYAARALEIAALELIAPLTPGAPLCRAHAPGSPADGCEIIFKGGQVGAENYFEIVMEGKA